MKHLKLILMATIMLVSAILFASCSTTGNTPGTDNNDSTVIDSGNSGNTSETPTPPVDDKTDILVVYFSATKNTESVANYNKSYLNADIYEITPAVPYTSADLNYNSDCRANREQNDPAARPEICGSVNNIEKYDVLFIG